MEKSKPRTTANVEASFIGKYTGADTGKSWEIEVELDNGLHTTIFVPYEFVSYDHSEILSETNRVKI